MNRESNFTHNPKHQSLGECIREERCIRRRVSKHGPVDWYHNKMLNWEVWEYPHEGYPMNFRGWWPMSNHEVRGREYEEIQRMD